VHYLRDSEVTIDGVRIYGTPWSARFGSWPFMKEEENLAITYEKIPEGLDILLSHGSAFGYGDDISHYNILMGGNFVENVGSKSLLNNICRAMPRHVCTGHIHAGSHRPMDLNLAKPVTITNVATCDDRFVKMYGEWVFEIGG